MHKHPLIALLKLKLERPDWALCCNGFCDVCPLPHGLALVARGWHPEDFYELARRSEGRPPEELERMMTTWVSRADARLADTERARLLELMLGLPIAKLLRFARDEWEAFLGVLLESVKGTPRYPALMARWLERAFGTTFPPRWSVRSAGSVAAAHRAFVLEYLLGKMVEHLQESANQLFQPAKDMHALARLNETGFHVKGYLELLARLRARIAGFGDHGESSLLRAGFLPEIDEAFKRAEEGIRKAYEVALPDEADVRENLWRDECQRRRDVQQRRDEEARCAREAQELEAQRAAQRAQDAAQREVADREIQRLADERRRHAHSERLQGNPRGLEGTTLVDTLRGLDPVDRLAGAIGATAFPLSLFPKQFALLSPADLGRVPANLVEELEQRLGGQRAGPWCHLLQRLRARDGREVTRILEGSTQQSRSHPMRGEE